MTFSHTSQPNLSKTTNLWLSPWKIYLFTSTLHLFWFGLVFLHSTEIHNILVLYFMCGFTCLCFNFNCLVCYSSIHNSCNATAQMNHAKTVGHMCVSYIPYHKEQTNYAKANVRFSYWQTMLTHNNNTVWISFVSVFRCVFGFSLSFALALAVILPANCAR